ncbi:MAG: hypothetical protein WCX71_00275 [Candidatus Buchananbacteria bacterium]
MERREISKNLAEVGFEVEPQPKFEVETIERQDSSGLQYNEYVYKIGDARISVYFKDQENLFDPEMVKDKVAVMVGDVPYAREPEKIKENKVSLEKSAAAVYDINLSGEYTKPYHPQVNVNYQCRAGGYNFKEYRINPSEADYPKPKTGLRKAELDNLRKAASKGSAVFVADGQPKSLADLAVMIRNSFPEGQFSASEIDVVKTEVLEDMIIALSFDESGILRDNSQNARNLILQALLGDKRISADLQQELEKKKHFSPPFLVRQCKLVLAGYKINLTSIQESESKSKMEYEKENFRKQAVEISSVIADLEDFIERHKNGEEVEIPERLVEALDQHVAIHMTAYEPIFDQESGDWIIPTHSGATGNKVGRITEHFAIDGIATAGFIGPGEWDKSNIGILAPLGQMVKENGVMANFMPADTYWVVDPNKLGIKIPKNSTVISTGLAEENLAKNSENDQIEFVPSSTEMTDLVKNILRKKYNVIFKRVGTDAWSDEEDSRRREREIVREIAKVFPGIIASGRHFGGFESNFEDTISNYYREVLLVDHQAEVAEDIEKSGDKKMQYLTKLPPEKIIDTWVKKSVLEFCNRVDWRENEVFLPREHARMLVREGII